MCLRPFARARGTCQINAAKKRRKIWGWEDSVRIGYREHGVTITFHTVIPSTICYVPPTMAWGDMPARSTAGYARSITRVVPPHTCALSLARGGPAIATFAAGPAKRTCNTEAARCRSVCKRLNQRRRQCNTGTHVLLPRCAALTRVCVVWSGQTADPRFQRCVPPP